MSKELIEKLREYADGEGSVQGYMADAMRQAADALEAKAAPVGEMEAAIALMNDAVLNGGWNNVREMGIHMFQAGAAYQRAQQPQSAGVVMPERKECDDGYPSDDWLIASAWNACLDEFARLNGKEVGRG